MTLKRNTFEGGSNGTGITSGNSGGGSGDAFNLVALGANATAVYSTAQAMHGTQSALITLSSAGTANNAQLVVNTPAGTTSVATAGYFRLPGNPAVQGGTLLLVGMTSGFAARLLLNPDSTVRLDDAGGAAKFTTPALTANTWYRIELVAIRGTTTTNGTINFAIYAGDSATAVTGMSYSATNLNTGTTATIANVQFGWTGTTAALSYAFHLDDPAVNDGATTFIGPQVSNAAPTANAGADQTAVEPWATVTLAGTDSDTDGTIATRTWAQTSGSPTVTLSGSGAGRTFTAPGTIAGTTLTFTYTVTDNAGASTADAMTVAVLPVTERAAVGGVMVPMRIRAIGG